MKEREYLVERERPEAGAQCETNNVWVRCCLHTLTVAEYDIPGS